MRTTTAVGWLAISAVLAVGCSGGSEDAVDFRQHALASLDEPCEGIAGLTGQAVLDRRFDGIGATLAYVTRTGAKVSSTALSLELTWPATPVAVCYPEYVSGASTTPPRVAIEGLSMRFSTEDGNFAETLPAKAWLTSQGGVPAVALVVGVASRHALSGSWTPFPDYDNGGGTLAFVNYLAGMSSGAMGGNVGLSATSLAEAGAGVFRSGNAVAIWPT